MYKSKEKSPMNEKQKEPRIIRAQYNESTVRVYQAYNHTIADQAIKTGNFGSAFKTERMTWIKPSFLWMMYRAGWGTKENQERILAIDITKTGFEEILSNAVLSSYHSDLYGTVENWKKKLTAAPVRCQWDPERDLYGNPLDKRSIQLGLSGIMVKKYISEYIVKITDITEQVHAWHQEISLHKFNPEELPKETEYPVSDPIKKILRM
jgi:hypothetical protein